MPDVATRTSKTQEQAPQTEAERVEAWRAGQFEKMGVPFDDIDTLAQSKADLHEAWKLLENGCPPHLVIKILA
jgi:hypothetical protein